MAEEFYGWRNGTPCRVADPSQGPCSIAEDEPPSETQTVVVNKQTHRIRYENETESVTVIIEPKE